MIKKILFPTDNSENSKSALNYVIELALKYNSEIVVLTCNDLFSDGYNVLAFAYTDEQEHNVDASYRNTINIALEQIGIKGINAKSLIIKGKAGLTIVNTIETEHCDMLVMGSRGLGSLKSLLLGSVSNYVIHHTKCPVLLVQ